jgi:Rieske 2Fe-2S family protein
MPGLQQSLPKESYISEAHWDLERERIFYREWFCVGRAGQLRAAGDYLVADVAGESVLVVRTKDGALAAHYNVCRHRGCRLSLDDARPSFEDDVPGASGRWHNSIRCPYHSWTYGFEGDLRGAPFMSDVEDFDKAEFSLHPVAVDEWGGFVFVHLTPGAHPALSESLGEVPHRLARYPLSGLEPARRITYEVAANWKVVMENYNECYHCAGVHPELCEIVPAFKERGGANLDWDRGIPHRDGAYTFTATGTSDRKPFDGLDADEQTRHKGELIYPNLLLSLSADHVTALVLWPRDANHTTIACDFLFAPSETARRDFDPSDAIEFWDRINRQDWTVCEGVQKGMSSRAFDVGYFAPMEDPSLDIRRYVSARMSP